MVSITLIAFILRDREINLTKQNLEQKKNKKIKSIL